MLNWLDDITDRMGNLVWVVILGAALIVGVFIVLTRPVRSEELDVIWLTLDAASTQENAYVPTISANLTLTPPESAATAAAPTQAVAGHREVRMFAASATASSQPDDLNQGAVQAVGPPNTPDCGDFTSAWATSSPTEQGWITLQYPELVTPTGLLVHQTYNPGFITRIDFIDIFGEPHTIYEDTPGLRPQCPYVLVVPVTEADYEGSRLTIHVDQTTSTGGWNQIDAVELIGIKH